MSYISTKDGGLAATVNRELNKFEAAGKEIFAVLMVTNQLLGILTRTPVKPTVDLELAPPPPVPVGLTANEYRPRPGGPNLKPGMSPAELTGAMKITPPAKPEAVLTQPVAPVPIAPVAPPSTPKRRSSRAAKQPEQ